ncbi:MAG TPA: radical SAM protein [Terriglobales bacterium]|nr:radical SAM protein [Terriglobales bacterium]
MRADEAATPHPGRLYKRQVPVELPITPASAALFRFGEQCNNHCPMCSNTGDPALFFHNTEELLRRAAFLHASGFRRVVVTGGEPTIHPGFWRIIDELRSLDMVWDTNTHGRSFAQSSFTDRAVASGLQRAIVSLHSFDPSVSAAIFGASEQAHQETVAGIDRLLAAGIEVIVNCVLSRLNLHQLDDYLRIGAARWPRASFKLVFPSTLGKGGKWPEIVGLRLADIAEPIRRARAVAKAAGIELWFESLPNCVIGDAEIVNYGRSTFGESHYLDDASGEHIYSMRHIEAEIFAFGENCRKCVAARRCSGVSHTYATSHGLDELVPFLTPSSAATLRRQLHSEPMA